MNTEFKKYDPTLSSKCKGFIITHGLSKYYCETNRLFFSPTSIKLVEPFRKGTATYTYGWYHSWPLSEVAYYGDEIDGVRIFPTNEVYIFEINDIPEWVTKTRTKAEKEAEYFGEKKRKERINKNLFYSWFKKIFRK